MLPTSYNVLLVHALRYTHDVSRFLDTAESLIVEIRCTEEVATSLPCSQYYEPTVMFLIGLTIDFWGRGAPRGRSISRGRLIDFGFRAAGGYRAGAQKTDA